MLINTVLVQMSNSLMHLKETRIKKILFFLHPEYILLGITLAVMSFIYVNKARMPLLLSVPPREAQMASQIRYYYNYGIDLFRAGYDLTPKPQYLILEFPFYQALVATIDKLLVYNDIWGKQVSVLFFVGSLIYLYKVILIVSHNNRMAILGILLFAIAPYNTRFQPVLMIDPFIGFLSLLVLYHGIKWLDSDKYIHLILFAAGGLLAFVTKFVPFIVVLVPFFAYFLLGTRNSCNFTVTRLARIVVIAIIWCFALILWYRWVSYLNGQTALNGFLMSKTGSLSSQFFGTLEERFNPISYSGVIWFLNEFFLTSNHLTIVVCLIMASLGFMILNKKYILLLFSGSWILGFVIDFYIFFRALSTHPYYWLPLIPALAFTLAYVLDYTLEIVSQVLDTAIRKCKSVSIYYIRFFPILIFISINVIFFAGALKGLNYYLQNNLLYKQVLNWENYEYLNYLAVLIGVFLGMFCFILALIRGEHRAALLAVLISITFSRFHSFAIDTREKWWASGDIGNHWVVTERTVLQTEYIKANLPESQLAAIVLHYTYSPHYLYMSGARGYTLAFPEKTRQGCISPHGFPFRLARPCIDLMYREGIKDIFVVFYASDDMDITEFKKQAQQYGLFFVGQMKQIDSNDAGNVLHYQIKQPTDSTP